jgi:hypothetical protein
VKMPVPLAVRYVAPAVLMMVTSAYGQTLPAAPVVPPAPNLGPLPAVAPEVRELLQLLHDRKDTLKDFTGKIDYSVTDKLGDTTGRRGTVDYVTDPLLGPKFSADFTMNTTEGKPTLKYHVQFIFDGREFTIKDYGQNNNVRQFVRSTVLKPGDKPGSAVALNGAMPLPIGLDVDDVIRNFDAALLPSTDANLPVLKLVPRVKGRFDYVELDVTVDKKQQLPVKLVQTAANGSVTTITLTELDINKGQAKILDAATPASEGWTQRQ